MICPNLTEARGISGQHAPEDCAAWLRDRGVQKVAIKMGRDGSFAADDRTAAHVAPFEVQAKDETGAGDAFAAGLIYGLLRDWPLEEAARLGNAVGALSTTGIGASTAPAGARGGPGAVNRAPRMNRLFAADGRCFDVAVDHGFFGESRFLTGIEDLDAALELLVEAAPDAIQLSPGSARLLQRRAGPKPALVLRTDVADVYGPTVESGRRYFSSSCPRPWNRQRASTRPAWS